MTQDQSPEPRNEDPQDQPFRPDAIAEEQWLEAVQSLLDLAEQSGVRELEVEAGPWRVRLRRSEPVSWQASLASLAVPSPAAPRETPGHHEVVAPLTGIWYDAPSPGATPYVVPGSHVEVGTAIGLIETMKIFNEIASDASGVVTQVHVRRGDLVVVHTPLISIDTSDTAATWLQRT